MMTVLINNFLDNTKKKEVVLQLRPVKDYHDILYGLGFTQWGGEDLNTVTYKGEFCYYYINPEGLLITLSGTLWEGDYKLTKLTKPTNI